MEDPRHHFRRRRLRAPSKSQCLLLLLMLAGAASTPPATSKDASQPSPGANSAGPEDPPPDVEDSSVPDTASPPPADDPGPPAFRFTKESYNVTIPENSFAKTYATPTDRMGISLGEEDSDVDVRYKIVAGDKTFKVEERVVGDFCFLLVRTRQGGVVLNRERKEWHHLTVRATGTRKNSTHRSVWSRTDEVLEAEAKVNVMVLDVNDLNPFFLNKSYDAVVPEDTPLHKSILRVQAEDPDQGKNGEVYLSLREPSLQFAIHPVSGEISLTRPLRFSDRAMHELTVVARDRGSLAKTSFGSHSEVTAKVNIRVKQVNLHAPEIFVHPLPDLVEQSNAHVYAIVRVADRDSGPHGEVCSLEIADGDPDGHFRIRPAGDPTARPGEFTVEVMRLLDRERSPRGYNLTLKATDCGVPPRQSYRALPVRLTDTNDNAPVFDREIYEVDVPETTPPNSPIIRLKVTDADEGKNAQVFLEIVGGNEGGNFRLHPDTGMLYTAKPLDAEDRAFHTLTVSAIDQGNAGTRKQSSAKVKINVKDTNDNDPLFDAAEMKVEMDENEPAGSSVAKVTARDRDSGENGYISYSIANLAPVPFEVDHFSGLVRTTQVLDYESMKREWVLRVRASDWGQPYRRETQMTLRVIVRDVNDNRPQFEKIACSGHVSRRLPIGAEVLTLSALDFDAGNIISYRTVSGNEDGCFALDATSGVLSVTCDLTDVGASERTVNVTATDGTHFADVVSVHMVLVNAKPSETNPLEAAAFDCRDTGVARRLTEVLAAAEKNNFPSAAREDFAMMPGRYGDNVHSPEFLDFPIQLLVNESVAIGSSLLKLRARDRDRGYNGKMVFGISEGDTDSVFKLDAETGVLRVVGRMDRERESEYMLNITVWDLGRPPKSASRMLPVAVLDVNDNAPKFERSVVSFNVPENATNGTIIFRANATDADMGDNAKITYSLETDTEEFKVDPVAGVLTVSGPLDREKRATYELRLRATDGGKEKALWTDALVRVIVDDVNDNPPLFSLPAGHSVRAREDLPVGTVVAVAGATDPDLGPGGEVRYSLVGEGGFPVSAFSVDPLTGTIRTAATLDFEERQSHLLTVVARDRGSPSLSSETTLLVEIVDVNENRHAPRFEDFVATATVPENQPVGTVVTRVMAKDADPPGDDSRLAYSIRGGDGLGYFSIDDQGTIRTLAVLDRESRRHFWITVYAKDHGTVPLHARLEVFISVLNENDNTPLTDEPVYFPHIPEGSPSGLVIVQLQATDADIPDVVVSSDGGYFPKLSYRITAGNPESFFSIDSETGTILTTGRKLDRENQAEHLLEVTVNDGGQPPLSSTTRVVITVDDINDHAPEFEQKFYKVKIPASMKDTLNDRPAFQVLAFDQDVGQNGEITYSIKSGRGKGKFKIHPKTGVVYAQRGFQPSQEFDLLVRAMDGGHPAKSQTARVAVQVVNVPKSSPHPPVIRSPNQRVHVTENDKVAFLVTLVLADDEDGDLLWYDITDGDARNEFFIGRDNGNVLLAKKLDWELQSEYNLTISVTDGVHVVFTQLYVTVLDINDHRPSFLDKVYRVEISENVEAGTKIMQLMATDEDEDKRVFYSLHAARNPASLSIFMVDSISGAITLNEKLDRENIEEHVLTVMVRDQGTPSKRNYARVIITVHDYNDHSPEFTSEIVQGKVYETASVGTAVAQIFAIDRDRGDNAKITYSIISGNVGNVFAIDAELGMVQVARQLDLSVMSEYMLIVKATDSGSPPLFSTVPLHIMVTMADYAPPRFTIQEHAAEIYENQPIGTYVKHIAARSTSSLFFEIINGNQDDMFFITPSTGVIITKRELDYELNKFYNLTVQTTNMASAKATCYVVIHVLDRNDNAPKFLQDLYIGTISEAADIGSLVLTNLSTPLVIKAEDNDSELNALLDYDIVESLPRKYFRIDSSTGAIRTVLNLDHEVWPEFNFHVKVSDLGKPRLSSETTANVRIIVGDVNDSPPRFLETSYNATVLLPTYGGVAVAQVSAYDPDSAEETELRYDIIEGNEGHAFAINEHSGLITVADPRVLEHAPSVRRLHTRVSDDKFSSITQVEIRLEKSKNSGLSFQKGLYTGTVLENSTKIAPVAVVNVIGGALGEHIMFSILNPTDLFEIGITSGAVQTTGKRFDREMQDYYELIIEAKSEEGEKDRPRFAHTKVGVTVLDVNDNCPLFVNLPYYAVVSVDAKKGDTVTKVHAIDLDKGENGEVRYELIKGHGELFKVCRKSGEITLKQNLEGHNREYDLIIAAYDGGMTPCATEITVHIKVIDRSMPVFDKQFYTDRVKENIEVNSPLSVSVQARSPLGRKLIYSIVKGNEFEEFSLDFNTAPDSNNGPCMIYVVDELDFELNKEHEMTIRATDSVSGVYAEVLVSILVEDVNDCPPEFTHDSYNVSVSEAAPFGTSILKVQTRDNDTGVNQNVRYVIQHNSSNSSDYFHIDPEDGTIYLKRSLDHELHSSHHFTVQAFDGGIPTLSSTAHVWITVIDMNDNPPKFEQPSYSCFLSEHARRGQFIMLVVASDPDDVDQGNLIYTIVGGNEQQTFSIDPRKGILTLINLQNFADHPMYLLNVSVTDGVYTSFARVKIDILSANKNNPTFPKVQFDVKVLENLPPGTFITKVTATDKDRGSYGTVVYSIASDRMKEYFEIDALTGEIITKKKLDRETQKLFEVLVMATDGGGRSGFVTLRVKVGDQNDNPPKFLLKEYKASIYSNLTAGTGFLKVKAVDADEDSSATVEYSIYEVGSSGVKDLFGINRHTGELYLLKTVASKENQMFQFFIRAQDRGSPSLSSEVPLDVYIMGPQDVAPLFERRDDKFFISENSPPGEIITRLKMVTNGTVKFRIISGNENIDNPLFDVNDQGQLFLVGKLDREVQDTHIIAIVAETDSSPPLTALTDVTLMVLDENDNSPVFESSPYKLTLAENIEEGTAVMKVTANDRDLGNNGEVRYSFGSEIGELANVFAIDAYTGWITTLVQLDAEKKPHYEFQVIATDNGKPKHFARTNVFIHLKDYNDNPPIFTSSHYMAAVNEDALPGTVVVLLSTKDKDTSLISPVQFYITNGDPMSQFQIRQTGEVYVAKSLDREKVSNYVLDVICTDGTYIAKTSVTIDVLDANDNPPYCLRYRYREVLSEGLHPGSYVLTVLATDIDEEPNANLRYYLTGNGAEKFILDKTSGHLKTGARPLDREKQSRFRLIAHVQDRDRTDWECSSLIEIILSDLNDNAPIFSMSSYSATLPENTDIGTLVAKVHATDLDIGINKKINYSFINSANQHFKIASDSGIVTLAKPLDREQRAVFNLTVKATDQGIPQLSKTVPLVVIVLDINDNPPEFEKKFYSGVVAEIDPIGTEVVRVLATSRDAGINAEITYSIVGGNDHKKFEIHNKTGIIKVIDHLDYEKAKDYVLTIQAVDGGTPPLSNHATVNISVTDSNDNPPVFTQVSYNARIREDAHVGDKILQVIANDLDSKNNGKVTYHIERGDRHQQFSINEKTGYISVAGQLDREMTSNYVLEVYAQDLGVPSLSSSVMVNIEISDANDNPPLFSQSNYTAIVQEDKPLGFTILKFMISDADGPPNAGPYTFDFRSGNEGNVFRLEQDGVLHTAAKFNHKIKDNYQLHLRVFDNGTPPLYSDTWVNVKVIEESQYPPVITPLDVVVNAFEDEFPGGVIGRIHASDQDPYDVLSFRLVPSTTLPNPNELFEIDREDGTIVALPHLDTGEYRLNISVSDGKFVSYMIVSAMVRPITEEMIENAVTLRLMGVSPEEFVISHRKGFTRAIRDAVVASSLKDVVIISLQQPSDWTGSHLHRGSRAAGSKDLDVLFVVRAKGGGYYLAKMVKEMVWGRRLEVENMLGFSIKEVAVERCTNTYCIHGICQDKIALDPSLVVTVSTDLAAFVAPRHHHKIECKCKEGYEGERCETMVNECARDPCVPFKVCIPDASPQGYSCQCPEGFAGPICNVDISKCHDESCYIPRNPVSFSGKSHAHYRVEKSHVKRVLEQRLNLSLRIRTVQPTGNLMFAEGKVDYNALEVVNGMVQYRFDLGSGEGMVRVSSIYVSDGRWHEVCLEREGSNAHIAVDGRHVAHGAAPGANDYLNLQSEDIFFGAEIRRHPTVLGFQDTQRGFSGCMDDIRLDGIPVPLHMSGGGMGAGGSVALLRQFANVEFRCEGQMTPPGPCGSQPCLNGGTCEEFLADGLPTHRCLCYGRFVGPACEIDMDPCASSPCLHSGRCHATPGGYTCECVDPRLSGRRCEYGQYCNPNPCRNGGVCEEGDSGPICKCRGFTGEFCAMDIDECIEGAPGMAGPCLGGGTCINEPGGYRCVCPADATGPRCGSPLHSTRVTSNQHSITMEELVGIIVALCVLLFLVIIYILFRRFRVKHSRERANNINNETRKDMVLNSTRPEPDFKRSSKLSNLEISQVPPQCPPRPASYTPSGANDPTTAAAVAFTTLNNLDTLRSYGSAGDELESTVPPDYLRNLNHSHTRGGLSNGGGTIGGVATTPLLVPVTSPNSVGGSDSLQKPWATETANLGMGDILVVGGGVQPSPHYPVDNNKIKNDLKGPSDGIYSHEVTPRALLGGGVGANVLRNGIGVGVGRAGVGGNNAPHMGMAGTSISSLSSIEDDPRMLGGYHWDCSDWVRPSQNPLPNITEVPGSEIPDSSSFHSNESNESNTHHGGGTIVPGVARGSGMADSGRDIETLNEEEDGESEYVVDSECGTEFEGECPDSPLLNGGRDEGGGVDSGSGGEEYHFKKDGSYLRHPNQYLPRYNVGSETETDEAMVPLRGGVANSRQLSGGAAEGDDSGEEDDAVVVYGFPRPKQTTRFEPERLSNGELGTSLGVSGLDEQMSLSMGGCTSASDLSNVCDIEDSEFETDIKKLNEKWPEITHTSV
ncbi:fat-like cadherin-related tumor suppressor homolog isoform X2 [Ischnura elegans]|uniref:fat-like cadherin-related tumor suppressor homolog isoform X2 n=1 Tax=Ischnura elegans TaxID=197161 RepID=UPI001ED8820E|nr:fat-like cadherin-related tumor suppressor homolog isoform X2 [Ischnura elegans]